MPTLSREGAQVKALVSGWGTPSGPTPVVHKGFSALFIKVPSSHLSWDTQILPLGAGGALAKPQPLNYEWGTQAAHRLQASGRPLPGGSACSVSGWGSPPPRGPHFLSRVSHLPQKRGPQASHPSGLGTTLFACH